MSGAAVPHPIRVLVVDDSPVARDLLAYLLNADPCLQVVGVAIDGEQAVSAAQRLRPDVITMDIHLPRLDGFAATRRIMETCPTRILMVTATAAATEVAANFRTLEAGALTVLAKPRGPGHPDYQVDAAELIRTVKLMAEVPVVRRWKRVTKAAAAAPATAVAAVAPAVSTSNSASASVRTSSATTRASASEVRLVAIGASTGGPLVLQTILSLLPRDFSAPIAVVQHISAGFTAGFIEWLHRTSGYPVRIPEHGELMLAGTAYFAPDGVHMLARRDGTVGLSDIALEHGMRPAVASLFRSVAAAYGPHAVGVLLTGMGRDGALELKQMRQAGALTIVQDKETAVVHGMPGEAIRLDAACYVLPPPEIAATLEWIVRKRRVHAAASDAR